MTCTGDNAAQLIRDVLDGRNAKDAMAGLVRIGGPAVEPICHAVVGNHGPANNSQRPGEALEDLTQVLMDIAKQDSDSVAEALSHELPAENLVVWALGHSDNEHATVLMNQLKESGDPGMEAVARFHRPD